MERSARPDSGPEINVTPIDKSDLFEIHTITDNKAGELKWLIPINIRGIQDPLRKPLFRGASIIQTPAGMKRLEFEIEAESLDEALTLWPKKLKEEILQFQKGLEELQQKALLARGMPMPGPPPSGRRS